jgi:hypothetical protein
METKSKQIQDALSIGDFKKAISLASKFFDRSEDTKLFKQAQSAINNPSFYKQVGKDPDAIVKSAIDLLSIKFCNT